MKSVEEIPIERVIQYISVKHLDQLYGNLPFVVHPVLVSRRFSDPLRIRVALLHDVVEDTATTLSEINSVFGPEIADGVDGVTRRPGEIYLEDFIVRCSRDPVSRDVKIADIEENLHSLLYWYPQYSHLEGRYKKALSFLKGVGQC